MKTRALDFEATPRRRSWLGVALITLLFLALFAIVTALFGFSVTEAWAKDATSTAQAKEDGKHQGQDFAWHGEVASGQTIEVMGVSGSIVAEPAAGPEAQVTARKSARHSDPDDVKIEVHRTEDGIRICARYPRPDGTLNECGESQHTRNNDTVVRFRLQVPKGVHLVAHTVNGEVEAEGLSGRVRVETVNGSIRIETSGEAEATTVNGSIRARVGSVQWTGRLSFETVNGRVVVTLPEGVGTEVRASTVNGHVESDFPLSVTGRISSRRVSGTIGKGGGELSLTTVNGGIELRSTAKAAR